MTHLNPKKVGLTLGLLLAGVHVVWSIIIALGWGQAWVNFVLWAHMVHQNVGIGPFDLSASLTVIVVAFIIGFIIGAVFSTIWNKLHKS